MVTVRLFAAARAAVGSSVVDAEAGTISDILARFASPVIDRCSFLVNGVATTDRSTGLTNGDTLDVLPPFAGG